MFTLRERLAMYSFITITFPGICPPLALVVEQIRQVVEEELDYDPTTECLHNRALKMGIGLFTEQDKYYISAVDATAWQQGYLLYTALFVFGQLGGKLDLDGESHAILAYLPPYAGCSWLEIK